MSVYCKNITKLNDTVVSPCTKPFPFLVYNNVNIYGMKNFFKHWAPANLNQLVRTFYLLILKKNFLVMNIYFC